MSKRTPRTSREADTNEHAEERREEHVDDPHQEYGSDSLHVVVVERWHHLGEEEGGKGDLLRARGQPSRIAVIGQLDRMASTVATHVQNDLTS